MSDLVCAPLTPERWGDLEELFGPRGATGGCWCMWWLKKRSEFERDKGDANRRDFRARVEQGPAPGILAYRAGKPVGWAAVAPRAAYPALARSRILAPVDEREVWSLPCFFVRRDERRGGVSVRLVEAAIAHARAAGVRVLEAYPVEPRDGRAADAFVWTGLASAFRRAGFREVARRSPTRPIMRYEIDEPRGEPDAR